MISLWTKQGDKFTIYRQGAEFMGEKMLRGEEKGRFVWLRRWGGVVLFALIGTLPLSSCTTAQLAYAVISAPTAKDKAEAQALVESLCKDAGTYIHRTV